MSIIVSGLTKIYGEQKAVDNISFEVGKGSVVGFLGPNGAGKSTTMKMLTTYVPPSSGSAIVAGFDITKEEMEVRKRVGYLPEGNPLYYDMYVREYLNFAAGIHKISNKESRIADIIEMTGLTKEVRKKIGQLSKGYKQRVGLAQAMIHNPEVLILDEPTTGLDPNQLEDIRNLIINIGKEKTVLLSTHIMQEVQAMCSRVIIIKNGVLVANDLIEDMQQQNTKAQSTILQVLFDKKIDKTIFKNFSDIIQAETMNGKEWFLETNASDKLRKSLMKWAVDQDLIIESMQVQTQSLEEIFRNLTK